MVWSALEKQKTLAEIQQLYRSSASSLPEPIVYELFNYILSVQFLQNKIKCSCASTSRKLDTVSESVTMMIMFLTILGHNISLAFGSIPSAILDSSQFLFKHGVEIEVDQSMSLQAKWDLVQHALIAAKETFERSHLHFILSGVTDFTTRRAKHGHLKVAQNRGIIEHSMFTPNSNNNIPNSLPLSYDGRFVNYFDASQQQAETLIEFSLKVNFEKDGKMYASFNDLMRLERKSYDSLYEISDSLKGTFGPLIMEE